MPDRLDDPALDLALGAERVDDAADVVDGVDALDDDLAGLDVDRDLGDLDAVRHHAHPGRIRSARAVAEDLPVLEQAGDLLEGPRAAVCADHVAPGEREDALLEVEALRGDLADLPRDVAGRRTDGRPHRRRRRGAARDGCVRAVRRVAELDRDAVDRQAELLGRDLRHRRPGAGADVLHRRQDGRRAVA